VLLSGTLIYPGRTRLQRCRRYQMHLPAPGAHVPEPQGEGRYQGQMAVYVKPRGRLGKEYMALIAPFRHWIVYPSLMRQIERAWNSGTARRAA